jgi:hypothetical protein
MLHFCHRHVFCAHHHGDATNERVGRKLVYGVASCGASFSANNVVFELRTVSCQIGRRAFHEWIICAHHGHWNLVRTPESWIDRRSWFCPRPTFRDAAIQVARLVHTIRSAVKAGSLAKAEAARTLEQERWQKAPEVTCCLSYKSPALAKD